MKMHQFSHKEVKRCNDDIDSDTLAKLTEEFIKKGGSITQLPPDLYGLNSNLNYGSSNYHIVEFHTPMCVYRKPVKLQWRRPTRNNYNS